MQSLLPKKTFHKNAHIYKILSSAKRLEILRLLSQGEIGVEEMLKITKMPKANLSQHLALLRHNGLVQTRREGQNIYYKIVDERIIEPCKILHKLRGRHIVV